MAISFVAAGTVATGASPTVTVPSGYAAGDLFIMLISASTLPTAPSGWTQLATTATAPVSIIYYKTASASESSVTLTGASSQCSAVIVAYRSTSGFDVTGTFTNTSGTSVSTSSITTTKANDYVISFYVTQNLSATITAPASTTTRVLFNPSTTRGLLIVDELQASAGASTSRTATVSIPLNLAAIATSISPSVTTNTSSFFFMF